MELHPLAQVKSPFAWIFEIAFPVGRQTRHEFARAVADVGLPGHQRVINGVTRELIRAGTTVRLPGGERNISHGNTVAGYGLCAGCSRKRQRE